MPGHHYALTAHDRVLAEVLELASWHLWGRMVLGEWDGRCERVQGALNLYGLGRS